MRPPRRPVARRSYFCFAGFDERRIDSALAVAILRQVSVMLQEAMRNYRLSVETAFLYQITWASTRALALPMCILSMSFITIVTRQDESGS